MQNVKHIALSYTLYYNWGLLNGHPLGQANTLIYNMWQYSSCSLQNCVFCSSKVFGYCTMYSYRGAHTADMWVNTAFSCRICHIMPSEICHSFFMLLQDPIFISTCMLTSGWLKSKSVSKGTSLKIWNWTPSTNPNGGRTLDSYRIEI